jgi:hypothetical protein
MKFNIRFPIENEDLSSYHSFDFTKLSAVNTCPTWGTLRYGHHKVFNATSREMALEAGSACHDVFAAARVFDLLTHGPKLYQRNNIEHLAIQRAVKLFGKDRTDKLIAEFDSTEDERTRILRCGLSILNSSGYYDDPSDKRRTMTNLEEACVAYLDRYTFGKNIPYVNGDYVGIETPINLVIEYEYLDDTQTTSTRTVRFVGRIDGVHCHHKTASRLGEAWEQSFEMSHQVTGYIAAAQTVTGLPINMGRVLGLAIPQPRLYNTDGMSTVTVFRRPHMFTDWANWFMHTAEMYIKWVDNPTEAPKYTHSCNRYFRPCSYIPICTTPPEERLEIMGEMLDKEWSPLHEKAND